MVSRAGQVRSLAVPRSASAAGGIEVEEYGYGLGPPTGILVLHYPRQPVVPEFAEDRDDFLHQVFWSPDGVLCVRRGDSSQVVASHEMLWVRRGVLAQVHGLGEQRVLRVCLRRVPTELTALASAVLTPVPQVGEQLLSLARPGVSETEGLRVRAEVLAGLVRAPAVALGAESASSRAGTHSTSPAHLVARALIADPADPTGLGQWADRLHVSSKTLQRDIERQFSTSFSALRTRLRLRAAAAMLAEHSVTETAHAVGYATASAFVTAFTREFGVTPGRFGLTDAAC